MIPEFEFKVICRQLKKFGFPNLKAYLDSDMWKAKRAEKLNGTKQTRRLNQLRCFCCGLYNIPLECHHRTYKRLGEEALSDLVWVCRECHEMIHRHKAIKKKTRRAFRRLKLVTKSVRRTRMKSGQYHSKRSQCFYKR